MSAPRAGIFDLDGTLVDSYAAIHDALAHTMRHFGLPEVTLEETYGLVGHGIERLVEKVLGPARVVEAVPIYRARYGEIMHAKTALLPGADAVTKALQARGIALAVAS